jgi:hypothetical protein
MNKRSDPRCIVFLIFVIFLGILLMEAYILNDNFK